MILNGAVARSQPGVVDQGSGRVIVDLDCRRCGYNLRTLAERGRCPECGSPVGFSTRGNFLRFADPIWVAKVANGLLIIFIMILVSFFMQLCVGIFVKESHVLSLFFGIAVAAAEFHGVCLITEPDPSGIGEEKNITSRKVLRVAALVTVIGAAFQAALTLFMVDAGAPVAIFLTSLAVITTIAQLVEWFAKYGYYAIIARRISDEALADRSLMIRKWTFVFVALAFVGGLCAALSSMVSSVGAVLAVIFIIPAGIGILVVAISTIVLIYRLPMSVKAEAEAAERNWSAASEALAQPVAAPPYVGGQSG